MLVLVTVFVTFCSLKVFLADKDVIANQLSERLYTAGLALQIWFILMLFRDCLTTFVSCCRKNDANNIFKALVTHLICSCLDNGVLGAFTIWTTVVITKVSAEDCDDDAACLGFYKATKANLIIGYLYIFTHVCCFPAFVYALVYFNDPGRQRVRE